MVKQWKKSLEQSDILSDGTPFNGANIDQPISEAGAGVDWASKTPESINDVLDNFTYNGQQIETITRTFQIVSGSGYYGGLENFTVNLNVEDAFADADNRYVFDATLDFLIDDSVYVTETNTGVFQNSAGNIISLDTLLPIHTRFVNNLKLETTIEITDIDGDPPELDADQFISKPDGNELSGIIGVLLD